MYSLCLLNSKPLKPQKKNNLEKFLLKKNILKINGRFFSSRKALVFYLKSDSLLQKNVLFDSLKAL